MSRQGAFDVGKRIFATLGHPDENRATQKLTPIRSDRIAHYLSVHLQSGSG